jgi:hypothetical protein
VARLLGAAVAVVAALAAPAAASADVGAAAQALRSDPVYVDPAAELAGEVDAGAVRDRIASAGAAPMFVAVLPESAVEGSAGKTLIALREAVGERGTYALAVGGEFRTLSDFYGAADAGDAARAAHPDDLGAALSAFVDHTGREHGKAGGGTLAGAVIAGAIMLAVLVGGVSLIVSRRRARSRRAAREERQLQYMDADFVRLGDGIRELELDATLTGDAAAKADYQRGLDAYDRANELAREGERAAADAAVDDGLRALGAARDRLAGRRPQSM